MNGSLSIGRRLLKNNLAHGYKAGMSWHQAAQGLAALYETPYTGSSKSEAKPFVTAMVAKFGSTLKAKGVVTDKKKNYVLDYIDKVVADAGSKSDKVKSPKKGKITATKVPDELRKRLFPLIAPHFGMPGFGQELNNILCDHLTSEEFKYRAALYNSFNGSNGVRSGSIRREESTGTDFYKTKGWKVCRYEALRRANGRCIVCGRGAAEGLKLHVDHIKPRSKFPELEHKIENLQVMCEECNEGKDNYDQTDWRQPISAASEIRVAEPIVKEVIRYIEVEKPRTKQQEEITQSVIISQRTALPKRSAFKSRMNQHNINL